MLNADQSTQTFNAIFSAFNYLESTVIWICTADCKKQLYINRAYEKVWGRSCESLQNHPESWIETLVPEDLPLIADEYSKRLESSFYESNIPLRIHRPDGELRWLKSSGYTLKNEEGHPGLIIGVDELITPEQWENWQPKLPQTQSYHLMKDFVSIIEKHFTA